jgi:hypothetical protein
LNGQIIRTYPSKGLAVIHPVTVRSVRPHAALGDDCEQARKRRRLIAAQHQRGPEVCPAGMHYRKSDLHQTNATKCCLGSFAGTNTKKPARI